MERIDKELIEACKNNESLDEITAIIKNGGFTNSKDEWGRNALMCAAKFHENPEVITALIARMPHINAKNKEGETALIIACAYNKNPAIVITLIEHGADLNMRCMERTALDFILKNESLKFTEARHKLQELQNEKMHMRN